VWLSPTQGINALQSPRVRGALALWRNVRAPFLAVLLALTMLRLQGTPFRIPNPAMVLLVFAVFATYTWRLRDGLATSLIAVAFALAYYSEAGRLFHYGPDRLRVVIGSTLATIALMTVLARSKTRISIALQSERIARDRVVTILENMTEGFVAIDREWRFLYVNAEAEKLLGRSRAEMVGRSILEVIPRMEGSIFHRNYRRAMEERVPVVFEARSLLVDKLFEVHAYPADTGIAVYFRDVTERHEALEAVRHSEERYRELFENANDLLYTHDLTGRFTSVNHSCVALTGYTHTELLRMNIADLVAPDSMEKTRQMLNLKIQQGGGATTYEVQVILKDGRQIPLEVSSRLLLDAGVAVGVQGIARDISERKRQETALRNMSLRDPLTGVYNRRGAIALADQQLKVAQRLGNTMLLLYADLNHLKEINDTHGHSAGDAALVEISQVLMETFRESDIIARMGGDEFVVLAMESSSANEETLRQRLVERLEMRNCSDGNVYPLSVSIGIARFDPFEPLSFEELVRVADKRMYDEKRKIFR
jgi:diguanylate cyclase (GGDEF)-like protein/PAS domain S-box-containing protein